MKIVLNIILFSNYFFLFYLVIYATYLMVSNLFGSIKMYGYRRMERLHNELEHEFYYPVSIIFLHITRTIRQFRP